MLTKQQAISIGKAVVQAAKNELRYHELQYEQQCTARSVAFKALGFIWCEFDDKLKSKFGYSSDSYFLACQYNDLLDVK